MQENIFKNYLWVDYVLKKPTETEPPGQRKLKSIKLWFLRQDSFFKVMLATKHKHIVALKYNFSKTYIPKIFPENTLNTYTLDFLTYEIENWPKSWDCELNLGYSRSLISRNVNVKQAAGPVKQQVDNFLFSQILVYWQVNILTQKVNWETTSYNFDVDVQRTISMAK